VNIMNDIMNIMNDTLNMTNIMNAVNITNISNESGYISRARARARAREILRGKKTSNAILASGLNGELGNK
jgi:hypothetical protein